MGRENGNPFENSSYNITGIAGGQAVTSSSPWNFSCFELKKPLRSVLKAMTLTV